MSDPAIEAAARVWDGDPKQLAHQLVDVAREALTPVRELHRPRWDNCINACCSGEQCKHRSRQCDGCDEYWPCATAKLIYPESELT